VTIKEHLVDCYRGHGFDFMTACELASAWIKDLKSQKPGTQWTLGPNRLGQSVTVRRD
jgi:hypothetical protein